MREQSASSFSPDSCLCLSPAEFACRAIRGTPPWWIKPHHEIEIERAITNAKRTEWDKKFRKQWYRASWQRDMREKRKQRAEAMQARQQLQAWR